MNKEVLKKIMQLANKGVGGEKENAKKILEKYEELAKEIEHQLFIDVVEFSVKPQSRDEFSLVIQVLGWFAEWNNEEKIKMIDMNKSTFDELFLLVSKDKAEVLEYIISIFLRDYRNEQQKIEENVAENIDALKKNIKELQKEIKTQKDRIKFFFDSFLEVNNLYAPKNNKKLKKMSEKEYIARLYNKGYIKKTVINTAIKTDRLAISKE